VWSAWAAAWLLLLIGEEDGRQQRSSMDTSKATSLRGWFIAVGVEQALDAVGAMCPDLQESARLGSPVHQSLLGLYPALCLANWSSPPHAIREFMGTVEDIHSVFTQHRSRRFVLDHLVATVSVVDVVLEAHRRIDRVYEQLDQQENPTLASGWKRCWATDCANMERWFIERVELSTDEMLVTDAQDPLNIVYELVAAKSDFRVVNGAAGAGAAGDHAFVNTEALVRLVTLIETTTRCVA